MAIILAIETATEACSAALLMNDNLTQRFAIALKEHAKLILPMCESLLQAAGITLSQVDAIAFGRGPGGFTGIRMAAGITQGLAFAYDLPVIPVSSLQALAQEARLKYKVSKILAGIDARRDEVYWCRYVLKDNFMQPEIEEAIISPIDLNCLGSGCPKEWFGAGSAWRQYKVLLNSFFADDLIDSDAELFPTARAVALLANRDWHFGKILNAEQAQPVYLRNKVV